MPVSTRRAENKAGTRPQGAGANQRNSKPRTGLKAEGVHAASTAEHAPIPVTDNTTPARLRSRVKLVSSKLAYDGPLFRVFTDQVQEPEGKVIRRDVVRHNGSVVVLLVDESNSTQDPLILLEEQYRHAAGEYLLELPAGKKEVGEQDLAAAKRELIEETGFRAKKWTKLVKYFASPGFLGEWMQIYLAREVQAGKAEPEHDEFINCRWVPLSKVMEAIRAGGIRDGKTLIGVQLYDNLRRAGSL